MSSIAKDALEHLIALSTRPALAETLSYLPTHFKKFAVVPLWRKNQTPTELFARVHQAYQNTPKNSRTIAVASEQGQAVALLATNDHVSNIAARFVIPGENYYLYVPEEDGELDCDFLDKAATALYGTPFTTAGWLDTTPAHVHAKKAQDIRQAFQDPV